jgi:hypothetical protein
VKSHEGDLEHMRLGSKWKDHWQRGKEVVALASGQSLPNRRYVFNQQLSFHPRVQAFANV